MKSHSFTRHISGLTACLGLGMLMAGSAAHAQMISVILNGSATALNIGSISASVTAGGAESATFTLGADYKFVLDDTRNQQLRWYQVIVYDDEPVAYMTKILSPAGTAKNTQDVVDVPSGGWDYESTTGNMGGDDTSPFYESDTVNNPVTGKPYRFPGLAYSALHSVAAGTSSTSDSPGLSGASHQTLFETYLTYENSDLFQAKEVDVLGGFSWGIKTDAASAKSGIDASYLNYADINTNAKKAELTAALGLSGFGGWNLRVTNSITAAPEPGMFALLLTSGLCGGMLMRRRKK